MDNKLEHARIFAIKAHGDQKYGHAPYSKHLEDVANVVQEFASEFQDPYIAQIAAWLHDTLEDTNTTIHDITNMFGGDVSELVWRVTNEPGRNRKERHRLTYPKIRDNREALALKLADRIANIRQSKATALDGKPSLLQMYRKEHPDFRNALYRVGELESMWVEINKLLI